MISSEDFYIAWFPCVAFALVALTIGLTLSSNVEQSVAVDDDATVYLAIVSEQ